MGWSFLTTGDWGFGGGFGIAAVIGGTIRIAMVAVVAAVALPLGSALCISQYPPRPIQRSLVGVTDLMAAVPGVVPGLWGAFFWQWRVRLAVGLDQRLVPPGRAQGRRPRAA